MLQASQGFKTMLARRPAVGVGKLPLRSVDASTSTTTLTILRAIASNSGNSSAGGGGGGGDSGHHPFKEPTPPRSRPASSRVPTTTGTQIPYGRTETIMPGLPQNYYGSLQDTPSPSYYRQPAAPWQAEHNMDVQRVTVKAMIYELIHSQTATIEQVVPWFLSTMPSSYFRQVPERFRMDHIKAIAAVKDANMDLYLNLKSHLADGRTVLTFVRQGTKPGTLLSMVEALPDKYNTDTPLTRLHVFSTEDESMSLNMFVYGNRKTSSVYTPQTDPDVDSYGYQASARILDYALALERGQEGPIQDLEPRLYERQGLVDYMKSCTENYLIAGAESPKRFLLQRVLYDIVSGTEGTAVMITPAERPEDAGHTWVDIAIANSLPQVALENLCRLLYHHNFDVSRARLDIVPNGDNGSVTILRTLISPVQGVGTPVPQETWDILSRELKRAKWLDPATMDLVFSRYPWLGVTRGEIITAFCSLMHPVLAKENAVIFSKANIYDAVSRERFIPHAAAIADLFQDRFNPRHPLDNAEFERRCALITSTIESDVEDSVAKEIFFKMLDIVKHTLKTNLYMEYRYALSLRLDPAVMVASTEAVNPRELPYGVVFVHGRRFNAYHVRFRDIARGGMRLVTPPSSEQYALESARHYDECYGLAFAQQLKNKDIPEGGSKAVNLVNVNGLSEKGKFFVMRKSVKAFIDSILDLIVNTDEAKQNIVDFLGKKEVLYIGPDEQVLPEDIEWIVKRAAYRQYETPAAFMSSKPRAGINHKEYGVTSESVNTYLDVALRHALKIDPKNDSFSVKMTGGPDGDVAGNEIKILIREYGANVKIVGIADHSGCAEDPKGLDHDELLRLVHAGLCIAHFNESKLSHEGRLHKCDTKEGTKARNSMHNRLEADAFLPCGGRPNTIDLTNYKNFLKEDGTPSSPLIVEGANLFVTAEARAALFKDAGVVIVKDSSANKGGVITSSYEICAAMLLSEDEFYTNKQQIVDEVLDKVRSLAAMEAKLLFREFDFYGGSLPEVSQVISNSINAATDALATAIEQLSDNDRESLLPLFRAHLPKTLADLSFDMVHDRVPDQYIKNAISSCLASKIVYKEGTRFISSQPPDKMVKLALKYLEKEKEVASLMESLQSSSVPETEKNRILELLEAGGVRTALSVY